MVSCRDGLEGLVQTHRGDCVLSDRDLARDNLPAGTPRSFKLSHDRKIAADSPAKPTYYPFLGGFRRSLTCLRGGFTLPDSPESPIGRFDGRPSGRSFRLSGL